MNLSDTILTLIIKHLSAQSSSADDTVLQQWRAESPSNEAEYYKVAKVWNSSGEVLQTKVDVSAQWESFRNQKFATEKKVIELQPAKSNVWYKYAAAAVVLIGMTLSGLWFTGNNIYKTGENQRLLVALADGTEITLTDNSTLTVPRTFNWFTRSLNVEGEGLFKIAKNPEKAFTIDGPTTTTKILGTAFRLVATINESKIEVAEGKVAYWANNKTDTLILTPGDAAEYKNFILKEIKLNEINVKSWFTGNYRFNKVSLKNVLTQLQDHYAFSLDTRLIKEDMNCGFSGSFKNQSKEDVIEELALAMNFSYIWKDDTLIIQNIQCN